MSTPRPSRFVESARIIRPASDTTTDHVKRAVVEALEVQRGGIDGLKGLRTVAIRVKIPAMAANPGAVIVNLEVE